MLRVVGLGRQGSLLTVRMYSMSISEAVAGTQAGWDPDTKRVGALARKCGMHRLFDRWGCLHTVTELRIDNCQVVQVKELGNGRTNLQLGAGDMKPKRVTKPMFNHFRKANVWPKRVLAEFAVSQSAVLPVGTEILARHFNVGQYVDVIGTSKGKGFQGAMRRWGFAGMGASHGVSKAHRSLGSTGGCQDPGRVWKGKKMAGQMGGGQVTSNNLQVYRVDCLTNSIFVTGCVPGPRHGWVRVRDALFKRNKQFREAQPPFPTFYPRPEDADIKVLEMAPPAQNPMEPYGIELPMEDYERWERKFIYAEDVSDEEMSDMEDGPDSDLD